MACTGYCGTEMSLVSCTGNCGGDEYCVMYWLLVQMSLVICTSYWGDVCILYTMSYTSIRENTHV